MASPVALVKARAGAGTASSSGCHWKRAGSALTGGSSEGEPGGASAQDPRPQANSAQASTSSVADRRGQRAMTRTSASNAAR